MRAVVTVILHLHSPGLSWEQEEIRLELARMPGILSVRMDPADGVILVRFDPTRAHLAEVVRRAEDAGAAVAGIAQRREVGSATRSLRARRRWPGHSPVASPSMRTVRARRGRQS